MEYVLPGILIVLAALLLGAVIILHDWTFWIVVGCAVISVLFGGRDPWTDTR